MSETAVQPSIRRFSLAHLVLIIPWVALVIDAWAPIRDNSFLWHIRAGTLQIDLSRVLTEDPFSFTLLGTSWRTQSWLVELLYAWGETRAGLGFVPVMLLATTTVTFAGIALIAYRRSGSVPATALLLLLSTVLMISFLVPRPVLFSYALFILVILAWDIPRLRWALPLLFWVWASVHGSFVIGLGFVGLSILSEREWRWVPTALMSGLVTLLTAHGLGVVDMLMDFSASRETLALLSEWRTPELFSPVFAPFVIGIALLVVGAARVVIRTRHFWLIVPFLLVGFSSIRAVPPAWLGLIPLVALSIRGLTTGSMERFSTRAGAIFVVVIALVPFFVKGDGSLDDERFPVEASRALREVPTFHDDRTGGYLIWAVWPQYLVYIDDRAELYGERMREFVAIRDAEQPWQPAFRRDGIEQALLETDDAITDELLTAGWSPVYRDDSFVVLRP